MAVEELSSPPRLRTLYPRALASLVPRPRARELPARELELRDLRPARAHALAYARTCGFRVRDELPPTYAHVLAFPLSLRLMTERAFPFPVVGLVHVRNRIVQRRALRAEEPLTLRVRAERLAPHDRGTQFVVLAEAEVEGELAWRGESTYLHRERGGGSSRERGERPEPPRAAAVWSLPADLGRRYAAVSGDRNPIHLHRLSARLFGMPRPIAHGMWLKARCLAALESVLPERLSVEARFKLPAFLPGRVAFSSEDGGGAFALHDARSGKPHLTGDVERG